MCKKCFKDELIYEYYECFQYDRDPKKDIYFEQNGKSYNLEEIIKLYNESYEDSKIEYQNVLQNIQEKKCIVCFLKNSIKLPCTCCNYCHHLNSYFKKYELKNSFVCPNKHRYSRKEMFKLGIQLYKIEEWKNDFTSIINYFNRRLIKNCFLCGENLEEQKFITKVYDYDKDEDSNKFLSKIAHYLCANCKKQQIPKKFNCQICHVLHTNKND